MLISLKPITRGRIFSTPPLSAILLGQEPILARAAGQSVHLVVVEHSLTRSVVSNEEVGAVKATGGSLEMGDTTGVTTGRQPLVHHGGQAPWTTCSSACPGRRCSPARQLFLVSIVGFEVLLTSQEKSRRTRGRV